MTGEIEKIEVKVEMLRLGDLRLLDAGQNARFMRHEQFQRLVQNIAADGTLTSVPFAVYDEPGKSPKVLSGNHRVMAATEALGPDTVVAVMTTRDELPKERALALQLAHNAIAGEDDPATLKALYEDLDNIDWRAYTGLDDKTLELLAEVQIGGLSEANLDFQTLTVVFLPDELVKAQATIDDAMATAKGADESWAVRFVDHERMLEAVETILTSNNVKNVATGFTMILDLFERHVTELSDGWWDSQLEEPKRNGWVPFATVSGYTAPTDSLGIVKQAVDRMIARGEASYPWQAIEFMAAEYLAGK